MIDWTGVFRNALWIFGLAVALAAFSYTDWQRARQTPRLSLRQALGQPGFQAAFSLGLGLFCAGLALSSQRWWETAAWAMLSLLFAWQMLASLRAQRAARQHPFPSEAAATPAAVPPTTDET